MEEEPADKKDHGEGNKTISGGNKTAGNESIGLNKTAGNESMKLNKTGDSNSTVSIPTAISADNKTAAADNKTAPAANKTISVPVGGSEGKDDASKADSKAESKGDLKADIKGKVDSAIGHWLSF